MKMESPGKAVVDDAFMQKFFDAWKRKDPDDIISMLTDDVVLESAFGPEVYGKRFSGKAAFREGIVRYFDALPGISSSDRTYAILGDKGFTEVTVSYPGPDGRQVTMRVCDLFDFRDGKVASKRAYAKRVAPE